MWFNDDDYDDDSNANPSSGGQGGCGAAMGGTPSSNTSPGGGDAMGPFPSSAGAGATSGKLELVVS